MNASAVTLQKIHLIAFCRKHFDSTLWFPCLIFTDPTLSIFSGGIDMIGKVILLFGYWCMPCFWHVHARDFFAAQYIGKIHRKRWRVKINMVFFLPLLWMKVAFSRNMTYTMACNLCKQKKFIYYVSHPHSLEYKDL